MHHTLFVLVYPSRLFAAHWSFWLPYDDASNHIGDRVHVTGDRLGGFQYEYIRNYDVSEDDRHPKALPIGIVSDTHLSKASKDENLAPSEKGQQDAEHVAFNAFDEACREVPAPGPSFNKVNRSDAAKAPGAPPKKAEVKDCQWWIKEAASHMVKTGMLLSLEEEDGKESPIRLPRH
ncbi:Uu.00g061080.m01.CDS01 [Anthostomella pinea]|uniref:Uu.00g061080.m01.CDS01 n=1 Tax=Anthostomella pinea TaxID=933095 RepID=A0AAI8VSF8_9PEZI|nr:Uu.00g061080.m01.CDS01 [Anthostomella pinea]